MYQNGCEHTCLVWNNAKHVSMLISLFVKWVVHYCARRWHFFMLNIDMAWGYITGLKVFRIRKLMQSADINTLDGDNQLHLIFYLHQCFITSDKTYIRFTVISICSLKQILFFYRHITNKTMCTSIRFPKPNVSLLSHFYFLIPNCWYNY
jgi:hypothetical protein